jgi:hypothetical protein
MSSIKISKSKKTKEVSVPVEEIPVPVEEVTPVPVEEVTPVPVEEVTPVEETTPVEGDEEPTFKQRLETLIKWRQHSIVECKAEITELKKLQKEFDVQLKLASKKKKKVVDPLAPPRKLTGFAAPCKVSEELHAFLLPFGIAEDELVSNTSVSKVFRDYFDTHKLHDPEHSKEFIPDAELKKILAPSTTHRVKDDPESPLVYIAFNIQQYIKHHFLRK